MAWVLQNRKVRENRKAEKSRGGKKMEERKKGTLNSYPQLRKACHRVGKYLSPIGKNHYKTKIKIQKF